MPKTKHLIMHKNIKNYPHQWYQWPQNFECHVSALLYAQLTIYSTGDKQGWRGNKNSLKRFGLLHNRKPLAKRLVLRFLPLKFSQFLALILVDTEILQGVPPLSWNQNFARVFPTEISLFLWSRHFSDNPNQSINIFYLVDTVSGCHWIIWILIRSFSFSFLVFRFFNNFFCLK